MQSNQEELALIVSHPTAPHMTFTSHGNGFAMPIEAVVGILMILFFDGYLLKDYVSVSM